MLKEKKTKVVQIRMDEDNWNKLNQLAFMMGTTPSGLARQLIQMSINASENVLKPAMDTMKEKAESINTQGDSYED